MAFAISPEVLAAFQRQADESEVREFVTWWKTHGSALGPPPPPQVAATVLSDAAETARARLGAEDNEMNRIFMQAVATRLMPEMDGRQFLLSADAIMSDAPDDKRVGELVRLVQAPR